jgi:hypothetical protein
MYEGKNGASRTLNWGTRIRVVLDAAQGNYAINNYS